MTQRTLTKEHIRDNLEIAINKQVSVNAADRFGIDSFLFKKQFEETQELIKFTKRKQHLSTFNKKVCGIDAEIKSKEQELLALSAFDKRKVARLENLAEKVTELRDDLELELSSYQEDDGSGCGCCAEHEEGLFDSDRDPSDTILQWRLARAPR